MKSVISVPLSDRAYDIVIAPSGLDHLGSWLANRERPLIKPGQKLLLVSNPVIFKHYGDRAVAALTQGGYRVSTCILPAGERYKNLRSLEKIYDAAQAHQLERGSALVALGGGVIGDMTGFAAATWLRGIAVVQVPTSLLAMVDAAIGGKTGVNHPQGKNLIGAFHQPQLVVIDPNVLKTLPAREFRAGMAEVIKYGVIWDPELFEALEAATRLDHYRYIPEELLHIILTRSAQAKAEVVAQDEKEGGLRAILNYGHTIGHAVESATHYRGVNHGEAVSIGMAAAAAIAMAQGHSETLARSLWHPSEAARQQALLTKTRLPTRIPAGLEAENLISLLQGDKKVQDGRVRFILPEALGRVTITDQVSHDDLYPVLTALGAQG
ncbi:3-dehydroquinate synthase [Leptolyngbya sp. PCC 6406]|uniref:3-dehydroquinate synthase n=1 Tax=Leptolyngbya sp. PCC 6406 TaxID=1173264 RepID=UPI0002AC306E|nr:3-dehydroquinate synthase [Leptolyngbya sp. PCC 6406]